MFIPAITFSLFGETNDQRAKRESSPLLDNSRSMCVYHIINLFSFICSWKQAQIDLPSSSTSELISIIFEGYLISKDDKIKLDNILIQPHLCESKHQDVDIEEFVFS